MIYYSLDNSILFTDRIQMLSGIVLRIHTKSHAKFLFFRPRKQPKSCTSGKNRLFLDKKIDKTDCSSDIEEPFWTTMQSSMGMQTTHEKRLQTSHNINEKDSRNQKTSSFGTIHHMFPVLFPNLRGVFVLVLRGNYVVHHSIASFG